MSQIFVTVTKSLFAWTFNEQSAYFAWWTKSKSGSTQRHVHHLKGQHSFEKAVTSMWRTLKAIKFWISLSFGAHGEGSRPRGIKKMQRCRLFTSAAFSCRRRGASGVAGPARSGPGAARARPGLPAARSGPGRSGRAVQPIPRRGRVRRDRPTSSNVCCRPYWRRETGHVV